MRDRLAGRADRLALCPLRRWLGGVSPDDAATWRRDAATGRLVRG